MSALQRAYEATTYRAVMPAGDAMIRIGRVCPELDGMLSEVDIPEWAFVSAANPGSVRCPATANEVRHALLLERLAEAGFVYFEGWGEPDSTEWEPEPSVLILGIPRTVAVDLARCFGQNAIVWGRRGEPAALTWC